MKEAAIISVTMCGVLMSGADDNHVIITFTYLKQTHVQTGPGAHPASFTMGTGSFPGVNRPGRGADHPPRSSAEDTNE
jgi:hypothetical protein